MEGAFSFILAQARDSCQETGSPAIDAYRGPRAPFVRIATLPTARSCSPRPTLS